MNDSDDGGAEWSCDGAVGFKRSGEVTRVSRSTLAGTRAANQRVPNTNLGAIDVWKVPLR